MRCLIVKVLNLKFICDFKMIQIKLKQDFGET